MSPPGGWHTVDGPGSCAVRHTSAHEGRCTRITGSGSGGGSSSWKLRGTIVDSQATVLPSAEILGFAFVPDRNSMLRSPTATARRLGPSQVMAMISAPEPVHTLFTVVTTVVPVASMSAPSEYRSRNSPAARFDVGTR